MASTTGSLEYIEALKGMTSRICSIVFPHVYAQSRGLYVVWVRGWDGVGRSAVLHHAVPAIIDKLGSSAVTSVHISRENAHLAIGQIHKEVLNMMNTEFLPYDGQVDGLSTRHWVYAVMVDSRMSGDVINLERLRYQLQNCSLKFVVASVLPKEIDGFSCYDVVGKFEDLEARAALGLLRDEAHGAVADLLIELGTNSSSRDPLPIHVDGDLILECLLYTTLFSSPRDLTDYWTSEGFLGDGFQHSDEVDKLMSILLRILEDRMLITTSRPMRMEIRAPLISKARVFFCSHEAMRGRLVLLKHSMHLKDFPADDDDDLKQQQQQQGGRSIMYRISLSNNAIETLPTSLRLPQCFPSLCTLLLDDNPGLRKIPDEVFSPNMPNLHVLDLSGTAICELPSSLQCCTNLRMLSLNRCLHLLTLLPTIEGAGLHRLEVLNLEGSPLTNMTKLSLQHMHNLKHLNFEDGPSNLEEFHLSLNNASKIFFMKESSKYDEYWIWSRNIRRAYFFISVRENYYGQRWRSGRINSIHNIKERLRCYANIFHTQVHPRLHHPINNTSTSRMIGENVKYLEIHGTALAVHPDTLLHHYAKICKPNIIYLCDSQEDTKIDLDEIFFTDTRSIRIERCHRVQKAFKINPENCDDYKPRIENVHLSYLRGLQTMSWSGFDHDGTILPHLKKIYIECCPNLCSLFDNYYPVRLPMLKVLVIKFCPRLQSLYSSRFTRLEKMACGEKHLPALETMVLCELPQLSRICQGPLPSIRRLKVRGCPRFVGVEGP